MAHPVTLILGDGTGPELAQVTRDVLDATGVAIDWVEVEAGIDIMESEGTPLPERVLEAIRETKTCIKAPITTPVGTGFRSVNVALRKEFDLYACVRPCKSYAGVRSRYEGIDLVIFRENTEDLYALGSDGIVVDDDLAVDFRVITAPGSDRIVRLAFEHAAKNGINRLTVVTKANVVKTSDGMFLDAARRISADYPDVKWDDWYIDIMTAKLIDPKRRAEFRVMVLPNLYGDILSDAAGGVIGGLGLAPSGCYGESYAYFESAHGTAPDIAGRNIINPTATILSAAMMLEYLGFDEAAGRIDTAVEEVYAEGKTLTPDQGGASSTTEFCAAVAERL